MILSRSGSYITGHDPDTIRDSTLKLGPVKNLQIFSVPVQNWTSARPVKQLSSSREILISVKLDHFKKQISKKYSDFYIKKIESCPGSYPDPQYCIEHAVFVLSVWKGRLFLLNRY